METNFNKLVKIKLGTLKGIKMPVLINYEIVKEIVEKLPEVEMERPAIAIGDRIFTWKDILKEVENDGSYSKRILEKLTEMRAGT